MSALQTVTAARGNAATPSAGARREKNAQDGQYVSLTQL
jgi:hypothetical protein